LGMSLPLYETTKRKITQQNRLSCSILRNFARLGKIFCKRYCT